MIPIPDTHKYGTVRKGVGETRSLFTNRQNVEIDVVEYFDLCDTELIFEGNGNLLYGEKE